MIDFRELAAALALELDVRDNDGGCELSLAARDNAMLPVRPIPIGVWPQRAQVVTHAGRTASVALRTSDGVLRLCPPVAV